jgi:hypothetical protein
VIRDIPGTINERDLGPLTPSLESGAVAPGQKAADLGSATCQTSGRLTSEQSHEAQRESDGRNR